VQLQDVHDQIMREGIAKHAGYEIITEGDSFQVTFASCQEAMAFCVEAQHRLVQQAWPKHVLSLNACKLTRGADGSVLFAGPRVRMGLHWAREGTVAVRLHSVTRHKVFAGPAVQVALDISEAAHGGQILLSEVRRRAAGSA
jgi:class 3 adenylate cyclase